ncbi:hypothetical protein C8R48DRAFT_780450 [Suillus tomentosus]|nr:hypothetical protein C8R48DRAFT_780450 [Suillus tomentosus]
MITDFILAVYLRPGGVKFEPSSFKLTHEMNEIFRLMVWANPSNEAKRGSDLHGLLECNMLESAWPGIVRTVWEVDPAIAVHLTKHFKSPAAHAEVQNLVRSNTSQVVDTPEALRFLIGDSFRSGPRRELKYIIVWAPVTPVITVTSNLYARR